MKPYVVEIETPTGRRVRKGVMAADENGAVRGIMHLQRTYGRLGIPKCTQGEIRDVWEREPSRPLPKQVLQSKDAMQLLQYFPLRLA